MRRLLATRPEPFTVTNFGAVRGEVQRVWLRLIEQVDAMVALAGSWPMHRSATGPGGSTDRL